MSAVSPGRPPRGVRLPRDEAERAARAAAATVEALRHTIATLENERSSRERFERAHQSWLGQEEVRAAARSALERASARLAEGEQLAQRAREERSAASVTVGRFRDEARPLERAVEGRRSAEVAYNNSRTALADLERASASSGTSGPPPRWPVPRARSTRRDGGSSSSNGRRCSPRSLRSPRVSPTRPERTGPTRSFSTRRDAARREELRTSAARTAAVERLEFAEERRAVAERGAAERRRHLAEAAQLDRTAAFVKGPFRDALLDLERRLLARAQATFERSFAKPSSMLVEDPGLLARCGPTFVPYVEIDGEMTPAEALSGGERTALALAFRAGARRGGPGLRTACGSIRSCSMSRPTAFRPEQVVRMGELLRSLPWGQVMVVTHEASLAGVADRTVRVTKAAASRSSKGGGTSPSRPRREPRRPAWRSGSTPPLAT